jgi:DNA-binding MarR family transcriptional regulator
VRRCPEGHVLTVATRRPDPDRLAVWRSFLEAHAALTRQLEQELEAERGLPLTWYDVLLHLQEAGGQLRMHDLADRVLLHKSSVTRLVDRMESAGLVERMVADDDGRSRFAMLTSEGRQTLRWAAPVHLRGIQRHFAAHLTDSDVLALARVFAKLPSADGD